LIGVFSTDILLDTLSKIVTDTKFDGGYAVLYDGTGTIVAHPNKKVLGKKSTIAAKFKNKKNRIINYNYKGEDKLLAFYRTTQTNWITAVTFTKKAAYKFLKEQSICLLILGFIILAKLSMILQTLQIKFKK